MIDLKIATVQHYDIGQMNMYLGYFAKEENDISDNEPIGIILTKDKDEVMVEYTMYNIESNLFVSRYQTYLPDKQLLKSKISDIINK